MCSCVSPCPHRGSVSQSKIARFWSASAILYPFLLCALLLSCWDITSGAIIVLWLCAFSCSSQERKGRVLESRFPALCPTAEGHPCITAAAAAFCSCCISCSCFHLWQIQSHLALSLSLLGWPAFPPHEQCPLSHEDRASENLLQPLVHHLCGSHQYDFDCLVRGNYCVTTLWLAPGTLCFQRKVFLQFLSSQRSLALMQWFPNF